MNKYTNDKTAELLEKVVLYNPKVHKNIIEKAMNFAARLHDGRKRISGELHFEHSFRIGMILADLKLDSHTIAAGIMHDALEYGVKPETIVKELDSETLGLIQSVSKLKRIRDNITEEEEESRRAENLRKIVLATAKDIRVIMIKLADRLDNMRYLKYLNDDARTKLAKETLDIYAPIAHKLGMYAMKAELEDLSFRYLQPEIYQDIKNKIASKKTQRDKEVLRIVSIVEEELKKNGITAVVYGRAKHFYSIYKKILDDNKKFDEIYDLIAIRIITNSVSDCYSCLGIVHKLWKPMNDRLKDYIATPKSNGYRSLHTNVLISPRKLLEVQIRDKEMDKIAEGGIAAHWRYKGDERDKKFDRQVEWLKQVLDWKRTAVDAMDFVESLKIDLFQKRMFVFTPKGDPIELPEDATPVDFAYAVHTGIGDHCRAAKVNGVMVPLDDELSPGDVVEILTVRNVVASRSWLSFVRSVHAKIKIRHALNMHSESGRKKNRESGRDNILGNKLRIDVHDRVGVLSDILSVIAKYKYNIKSLNTGFARDGRVIINIDFFHVHERMDELITQIKGLESVITAHME